MKTKLNAVDLMILRTWMIFTKYIKHSDGSRSENNLLQIAKCQAGIEVR